MIFIFVLMIVAGLAYTIIENPPKKTWIGILALSLAWIWAYYVLFKVGQ